ncbi:Protein kinase [Aphelenchoides fujianensis]|nr:Protein kinase [Aphelenchoides fujianensis]
MAAPPAPSAAPANPPPANPPPASAAGAAPPAQQPAAAVVVAAAVYKAAVVDECALPPLVAIKAERAESLEMEVRVLEAVAPSVHFCALLDRGLDPQSGCPFVVMSLLGPNLSVVRKAMPGQRLSLSTADDVESWLYSLVELAVGRLPWAALDKQAKEATFRAKLDVRRAQRRAFFAPLPHQFDHARVMLARIDAYNYYSRPDYGQASSFQC